MLYIRLFHGRTDPSQDMDDWGSDGPILGPYKFVHTTYAHHLKLGRPDGSCDELFIYEDMLYYDGIYYGDRSVFGIEVLKESQFQVSVFQQLKAKLPEKT